MHAGRRWVDKVSMLNSRNYKSSEVFRVVRTEGGYCQRRFGRSYAVAIIVSFHIPKEHSTQGRSAVLTIIIPGLFAFELTPRLLLTLALHKKHVNLYQRFVSKRVLAYII